VRTVLARTTKVPAFHKDYSRSELELQAGTAVRPVRHFDDERVLCSLGPKYPGVFTVVIEASNLQVRAAFSEDEMWAAYQSAGQEAVLPPDNELVEDVEKDDEKGPAQMVSITGPEGKGIPVPVEGIDEVNYLDEAKYGKRFRFVAVPIDLSHANLNKLKTVQWFVNMMVNTGDTEGVEKFESSSNPVTTLYELVSNHLSNIEALLNSAKATPENRKAIERTAGALRSLKSRLYGKARGLKSKMKAGEVEELRPIYRLVDMDEQRAYDVESKDDAFDKAESLVGVEQSTLTPETLSYKRFGIRKNYDPQTGKKSFTVYHPKAPDVALSEPFKKLEDAHAFVDANWTELMQKVIKGT